MTTKLGRPKKQPADKASRVLYLKLTPGERAAIEAGAGAAGEQLAAWARNVLLRRANRLTAAKKPKVLPPGRPAKHAPENGA